MHAVIPPTTRLSVPRIALTVLTLLSTTLATPAWAVDKDLVAYAEACAGKIAEVPAFNCLDGNPIPMTGTEGGTCDAPPYLPEAGCHGHSRIGELATDDENVGIVFLCRHKETQPIQSNKWQDIAVIQTNFRTGATCFFQQLSKTSTLSGDVKSPSSGDTQWLTPTKMASSGNACVQCHDSGAFIRTPYLKPVIANLKAFQRFRARSSSERTKYWFPGSSFLFYKHGKNWNGAVHRVVDTAAGDACTKCHEMGTNSIDKTLGSSLWLGPYATGLDPTPFLQNGSGLNGDLAHWMKPGITTPDQASMDHATTMRECALKDQSSGTCTQAPFDGQVDELARMAHDALLRAAPPSARPDD